MAQPETTPYENDDTRLWTLERRVHMMEMGMDSIEMRIGRIEESVRDLRTAVFNQALFFGILIIISNGIIGALL
tara:strand:+ start:107 stop:328 length:222 start_codon:yes stop_codon:yes gene_type:complete